MSGREPVDNGVDGVAFIFFEFWYIAVEVDNFAVYSGPYESVLADFIDGIAVFTLCAGGDRGEDHQSSAFRDSGDLLTYFLSGLGSEFASAFWAVRGAGVGVQQSQIVINFGNGGYGGTWRRAGGALFDSDCRGESFDMPYFRFLHAVEEHTCISGQALDISALTFGVEGIESEGRLAGAAQSGNNHEFIAWYSNVDIFEIVLGCAFYNDVMDHDIPSSGKHCYII